MKIGFDADKAFSDFAGPGNYSRRVITAITSEIGTGSVCLFGSVRPDPQAMALLPKEIKTITPGSNKQGKFASEWWKAFSEPALINRNKIDVFHGLANELPWNINKCGCKKIVTIHDLIFLRRPDTIGNFHRMTMELKTRRACHVADAIVAVSQRTRDDLIALYGINPKKIHVIYQSISPQYFMPVTHSVRNIIRDKYSLPKDYILCVGTLERRKQQKLLVETLQFLPASVSLVLVGKTTPYYSEIIDTANRLDVASRVRILTGVPNSDLPAIYSCARISANPSLYEGFGIPVAEALATGVPVVAASGSCLEEAGGPSTIYLSPVVTPQKWAETFENILSDDELAAKMSEDGINYAARFTDRSLAANLMTLYESVTGFHT